MPYSISVKDRMMYSHTFTFGDGVPFTTGCTSVVTATLEGEALGPHEILIDILVAQQLLRECCALYDHKNLDTLAEFRRADSSLMNTTVEVMAKAIYQQLLLRLRSHHAEHSSADGKGLGAITGLRITLEESDVASASYWEANAKGLFT
uniref:6-pyruvoyltetrahydropterin synthase n=1 Tax=Calcidiscus leptoporus TaxID=127549 RepID=A0A6U5FYV4_9EUKA|mmetsp:Transcript_28061/g.65579  ORF Transcript_28061/g.65579 Transcript_28061/m.65579 type:complete len:149 (+) Transcript_28061:90-536(+)